MRKPPPGLLYHKNPKAEEEFLLKKPSNLQRLLGYAGSRKYLTYASWVLSALSALLALVPYWYIWQVIREVLAAAPDFGQARGLVQKRLDGGAVRGDRSAGLHRRPDVLPSWGPSASPPTCALPP